MSGRRRLPITASDAADSSFDLIANHELSFASPSPPAAARTVRDRARRPDRRPTAAGSSFATARTPSPPKSSPGRAPSSRALCVHGSRNKFAALHAVVAPDGTVPLVEVTVREDADSGRSAGQVHPAHPCGLPGRQRCGGRRERARAPDPGARHRARGHAVHQPVVRAAGAGGAAGAVAGGTAEVPFFNLSGGQKRAAREGARGRDRFGDRGDRHGGVPAAGGPGRAVGRRRQSRPERVDREKRPSRGPIARAGRRSGPSIRRRRARAASIARRCTAPRPRRADSPDRRAPGSACRSRQHPEQRRSAARVRPPAARPRERRRQAAQPAPPAAASQNSIAQREHERHQRAEHRLVGKRASPAQIDVLRPALDQCGEALVHPRFHQVVREGEIEPAPPRRTHACASARSSATSPRTASWVPTAS